MSTSETRDARTTLVIGGTGKTGRRVAERLVTRGHRARVASRSGDVRFDWNDPATWAPALRGADAAYVAYAPDLAVPGAVDAIRAFVGVALEQGTRRLVLLSGRGEEEAQRAEQVVRESRAEWTIVRASWFAQNFSEGYLRAPVLSGVVALPVGSVAEPFVDADDIADVAVAALTEAGHAGALYEVTGPRLMTFADAVDEIARASGRRIRYVRITAEAYASAIAEAGLPPDAAWLIEYLFTTVLDGRNASLADGVQRALGREPRDFADFARDAASRGAWAVEPHVPAPVPA